MSILLVNANSLRIPLADESVHMCVTSPPYWGLRSYGTARWEGGDPECDHTMITHSTRGGPKSTITGGQDTTAHKMNYRDICGKCGAVRVDNQLGLEETPELYVEHMTLVFREVRRVLHPTGVVFLNIGDSYNGSGGAGGDYSDGRLREGQPRYPGRKAATLKPKDLCLVPFRLALALQADGWYVRSDIAWIKKAPMPESVQDRPTSAWEHVFLLAKNEKYFYDAEAVREENSSPEQLEHNLKYAKPYEVYDRRAPMTGQPGNVNNIGIHSRPGSPGRNMRNYWILGPEPYPGSHFAVFPTEIPRRAIKAGTSERGVCPACKAPYERITERIEMDDPPGYNGSKFNHGKTVVPHANTGNGRRGVSRSAGWQPTCTCNAGDPIPATVLDPFVGSGTTCLVAQQLGRNAVGLDLSGEYLRLARERTGLAALEEWTAGRRVEEAADLGPLFGGRP